MYNIYIIYLISAGEVFQHWKDFGHVATLVSLVTSALYKKPGRKARYLDFLGECVPKELVRLPPLPSATRWNSWFEAIIYHASHIHIYEGFFKSEKSAGQAVERILELCRNKEVFAYMVLYLHFLAENCSRLISTLTSFEDTQPLAVQAYNRLEDLRQYFTAGKSKTSFGVETDRHLQKLSAPDKAKVTKSFRSVFDKSLKKLQSHSC